jgi:UDP-GlcNAc:undecaprenyl-phosphate/decaprenyl-phosphate GlcNAc-1-phosphate transferase
LPLLLNGLPVLDTLTVIVLRLHAGRSPFSADRHHFHHRLLDLGFDHYEVVIVVYAVQCLLLLLAWQLRYENDLLIVASFVGFAVLFTGGFMLLERAGWRWRIAGVASHPSPLARFRACLHASERFPRWSMRVLGLCAVVYLLGIAVYAEPVPRDIGWLSAALCLLPLLLSARGPRSAFAETWLVRGALYVAVIVAVYLDQGTSMQAPLWRAVKYAFLPLLAVSVVLGLRLSAQRRFEATPLDLLLIFGALALPNLPGLAAAPSNFGPSAAKLVVLCYAVEMIAVIGSRLRTALLGTAGVFYLLIAVRAFS